MSKRVWVVMGVDRGDDFTEALRVFRDAGRADKAAGVYNRSPRSCPAAGRAVATTYECRHDHHWVDGPVGLSLKPGATP